VIGVIDDINDIGRRCLVALGIVDVVFRLVHKVLPWGRPWS
jgi:hypothetical protein